MTPLLYLILASTATDDALHTSRRFVVYSDNRGANTIHAHLLATLARRPPQLIVHLGDLVDPYRRDGLPALRAQVNQHFGSWDRYCAKLYLTLGGHEERWMNRSRISGGAEPDNAAGQAFYRELGLPGRMRHRSPYGDYTFQALGVYFVVLYVSDEWLASGKQHATDPVEWRQQAWLEQALWLTARLAAIRQTAPQAPLVVLAHQQEWFLREPSEPAHPRSLFADLLRQYRVDLALAGDAHDYYAVADPTTLKLRDGSPGHGVAMFLDVEVLLDRFRITARTPDDKLLISPFYPTIWEKPFGGKPYPLPRSAQ